MMRGDVAVLAGGQCSDKNNAAYISDHVSQYRISSDTWESGDFSLPVGLEQHTLITINM